MSKIPLLILALLLLSACGTLATPDPLVTEVPLVIPTEHSAEGEGGAVAVLPTSTPLPPTATPIPPTATPTLEPTPEPMVEPTVAEETGGEVADPNAPLAPPVITDTDQTSVLVSFADPNAGRTIFNMSYDTALGANMCATCHYVTPEETEGVKSGPSLWNLRDRAGERVEGLSAAEYIYNSIIHPNDYIVEGYAPGVMPPNYEELLSQQEVYNLVSYLLTVGD